MSDTNQVLIPAAFVALYVPAGRSRPSETRDHIAARHEICEDMACMLVEPAQTKRWELGITESDVLDRMHRALVGDAAVLSRAEAGWVVHRLAELLDWDCPPLPD
ncbi:MAG: ATPase with chaperone activity [Burkholderiales bacterium]|nr:ATPase with chaperone activity [Burkholderiales bacterium]MDE1925967.1 ATPase with chaperone activity [Burkholderiales bacterium]MDE2159692.1 ATPase with chaperone activity [Burkholderiales bacterium]MDE2505241.1 ATPase with chaperone activity [Burkholderiales bacterium]